MMIPENTRLVGETFAAPKTAGMYAPPPRLCHGLIGVGECIHSLAASLLHCKAGSSRSFAAIRKEAGLFCGSFLRNGEAFAYVGRIQHLKDPTDRMTSCPCVHMQTLVIDKLGFNQNYYTFTLILLIKTVLCSNP